MEAESTCIGFGERQGTCTNQPDLNLNLAGLWCTECEQERRRHISGQMEQITERFNKERV